VIHKCFRHGFLWIADMCHTQKMHCLLQRIETEKHSTLHAVSQIVFSVRILTILFIL